MRLAHSRWWFAAGASFLLVGGIWLLWRQAAQTSVGRPEPPQPVLTIPSINLVGHSPTGAREWTLTALEVSVSPDQRIFRSSGIRDGLFYRDGKAVARFTAGSATFDQATKTLDLADSIRVDATNGVRLRCQTLHYTPLSHRLRAGGPILITTKQNSFTAGVLSADLALDELDFESTPTQPVTFTASGGPNGPV